MPTTPSRRCSAERRASRCSRCPSSSANTSSNHRLWIFPGRAPGKTPGLPGVLFCARERSSGPGLGFVFLHRFLQVAVFLAGKKAQLVELRQVLLRLRQVVRHPIGLADVFVCSLVPRVELQRFVVVLERKV